MHNFQLQTELLNVTNEPNKQIADYKKKLNFTSHI